MLLLRAILSFTLILALFILICNRYMAPEYAMSGQFSMKSNVFSFGVLILEIVSNRKVICLDNGENREHLLSFVSLNIQSYISIILKK